MKNRIHILIIVFFCIQLTSCINEAKFDNTPGGNFELLWKIIDENYCFHTYKQTNWDEVYVEYKDQITPYMSDNELFDVLGNMLAELRDGHVNLFFGDNRVSYWNWFNDYPRNFNEYIIHSYMGSGYRAVDGVKYAVLDNNIGYIYLENFSYDMSTQNMDVMFKVLERCKGLIIDVRCNGGGAISNSRRLASRFTTEKILVGYLTHKTGKGHDDFSSPVPIYIEPSANVQWKKKVIILTNRQTYSAANDFVNCMNYLPQVTLLGDITGGGSGLPFSSELPNGWHVRFSVSPHFNADMGHIEFGIQPDIEIDLDPKDEEKGIDTILEKACFLLSE